MTDLPNPPSRRWLIDNMMQGHPPPPANDPQRAKYFSIMASNMRVTDRRWATVVQMMGAPWADLDCSQAGAEDRQRQMDEGVEL